VLMVPKIPAREGKGDETMSEPMYILLKVYPDGTVEAMPVADNEQESLKALAAWRKVMVCRSGKEPLSEGKESFEHARQRSADQRYFT
jgi:hypothetical protein